MSWALPLFRAFGIQVRVHLLFFLVTLGFFLRDTVLDKGNVVAWGDVFLFTVGLLFLVILLHEFGHCFGARAVDGEAKEILIWPLGGLAFNDIPHGPRPLFVTVAAGPAVNVVICVAAAGLLALAGFLPNLTFGNPYVSKMYNFLDGREYTSPYGLRLYAAGSSDPTQAPEEKRKQVVFENQALYDRVAYPPEINAQLAQAAGPNVERALAPAWAVWLNRTFWVSWALFLFNLLPAYPLDGGQLLQSYIWARSDYRRGVTVACYSGFVVAVLFLLAAIAFNESLLMGLSLFMLFQSMTKLASLDAEDGPFGYDFSAGYTSLERDDPPPPRKKQPGAFARWWQARKARKLQLQAAQQARDEERMDELLAKIARTGKNSLSDEERRFLERVSARYRNR